MTLKHSEKGFTLIELMVVMLIVSALIVTALPALGAIRSRVYARACQANLITLDIAVQAWKAANPEVDYPGPNQENKLRDDLLSGGYIKRMPVCPEGSNNNRHADAYYIVGGGGTVPPVIVCPNGHKYRAY